MGGRFVFHLPCLSGCPQNFVGAGGEAAPARGARGGRAVGAPLLPGAQVMNAFGLVC